MKKIMLILIVAAFFMAGCSKEEMNRLKMENANLRAEKAGLEARMREVVAERDSINAKYEMIKEIIQGSDGKPVPAISE